jgi:hypothetical protein
VKLLLAIAGVLSLIVPTAIFAAAADPFEPPATPAGGTPNPSITAGTVIGIAIVVGAAAALAGGGGDDVQLPATGTTGTGTGP